MGNLQSQYPDSPSRSAAAAEAVSDSNKEMFLKVRERSIVSATAILLALTDNLPLHIQRILDDLRFVQWEGYVEKQSEVLKRWRQRYFVLEGTILTCKDSLPRPPTWSVNLPPTKS